ncbi:MAG TPA: hypothetical protein VLG47_05260 [Candidatus Saccharimonadales bacterium]|nr:hypothetical protein [Candidatus Saccharimonadales bacterium]
MNQYEGTMKSTRQISQPDKTAVQQQESRQETRAELRHAIIGSNQVLATATTVLAIFPDTFALDRAKLTVTKRHFFSTAEVMSIRVEDILNVTAKLDPLFGSIQVVSRIMGVEQVNTIGNFWRREAMRLKRITQGYVIALQRHIDCSSLGTPELVSLLDELGEDNHEQAQQK